jgi:hypothetical protein
MKLQQATDDQTTLCEHTIRVMLVCTKAEQITSLRWILRRLRKKYRGLALKFLDGEIKAL